MRESEHPLPQIDVLTPEAYEAKYPPPGPPGAEEQAWTAKLVSAYTLLGFLHPGWKPDSATKLTAPLITYDIKSQVLNIVADGSDPESELYGLGADRRR